MSDSSKAVFLSYASQDAEVVRRIADALRAAGVEVWFDQNELVGGDAWDAKIRKQIKECALFVPVISAATQARLEGYFRIEWKLAARRTHAMATAKAFLLPVVIDDTRDAEAHVPDEFRDVQWTRLHGGEVPSGFCARVESLLTSGTGVRSVTGNHGHDVRATMTAPRLRSLWSWVAIAAVATVVAGLAIWRPWQAGPASGGVPGRSPVKPDRVPALAQSPATEQLARARAILAKTDVVRAELDTAAGLADGAIKAEGAHAEAYAVRALVDWRYAIENLDSSSARLDTMRQHARQAMSLDASNPAAQLAQARAMVLLSDTPTTRDAAVKLLEPLAQRPEVDVQVLLALGWLEHARREKALAYFERAARMPGGAGQAHFARAMLHWRERELPAAAEAIDQALAVEHAAKFLFWKSYIQLIWEGNAVAADRTGRELPADLLVEDFVMSFRYITQLYLRDYEGALATLRAFPRDFIGSGDGSGTTGYFKGYVLARAGKTAAAEIEWRAALDVVERRLQVAPNERGLLVHKAFLLASLGDKPAADKLWRATRELFGGAAASWGEHHIRFLLLPDDEALEYLAGEVERAQPSPWAFAGNLRLDPYLDRLRGHPRFATLLARAEADPRLSPQSTKPATKAAVPYAPLYTKSIAVLAFRQHSADPENEYLCEAIPDELCNKLGSVPGLRVAASASAFSFKGKRVRPSEMAAQLGVAYLVDGSVQKIGNRVRVRAELIKASDESSVWKSELPDYEVKNMFEVQDAVVAAIAKNLQLQLGGATQETVAMNPAAYRLYYEGRYAWTQRAAWTPEQADHALALYRQAVALQPSFGRAYAGIVDIGIFTGTRGQSGRYGDRNSRALLELLALADKAVQLEPGSAEAHTARGRVLWLMWRSAESERELRAAIELNASYADAHLNLGRVLHADGRMDEALSALRRAAELDPLTSRMFDNWSLVLLDTGVPREALVQADRARALQPSSHEADRLRMLAFSGAGRYAEAVELARMPERQNSTFAAVAFARAGLAEEAMRVIDALRGSTQSRATALAALGRREEALQTLEPDGASLLGVGFLFYQPEFDPIRNDPRFVRFLEQVGWTDAHARAQAWRKAHPPEKPEAKR